MSIFIFNRKHKEGVLIRNAFNNYKEEYLSQLEKNKVNGLDGEHLGAAHLTLALRARVNWGSRTEDDAKVDLNTIFDNPWEKNEVQNIFTQIKSGHSFASVITKEGAFCFKIDKEKFKVYINREHHSLICWVDRNNDELYWFLVKKHAKFFRDEYGPSHKLTPATRYDIIRIINSFDRGKDGGKGLIFSVKKEIDWRDYSGFKKLRKKAKAIYKRNNNRHVKNPLFGKIEFTKLGWRHMTREARLNTYMVSSFEILQILEKILQKAPSKHFIQNYYQEQDEEQNYRKIEYLLRYDNISRNSTKLEKIEKVSAYIKLVEFISYPKNWKTNSKLTRSIKRRVLFKSVYYKYIL